MEDQARRPALVGPTHLLKVSASLVDRPVQNCGMHGALKARPKVQSADWSPRGSNQPFLLGLIRDVALGVHGNPKADTWEGLNEILNEALSRYSLHPGMKLYARTAIENYLDCHDVIQQELGPLQLKTCDPAVPMGPNNLLTVWAPVYETTSGIREVRRLRVRSARPVGAKPDPWTVVAAMVASQVRPLGSLQKIRIVEVGLGDGSAAITFDGTPLEAQSNYEALAVPKIRDIVNATAASPGLSCKECKITGSCNSLLKLNGFLGQSNPGPCTRSVSARDIEVYETCPAQWLLSQSSFLPAENTAKHASTRGISVHRLLAACHSSAGRCTPESFEGVITDDPHLDGDEDFEVRKYIQNHAENCPITDAIKVIGSEVPIYGYDEHSDVVIASKPDMVYIDRDETLVIRETKTTSLKIPNDEAEAFDKYLAVSWLINLFASGYRGPFHSDSARFELEVISPTESRVFSWDLNDQGLLRMAQKEVRIRARGWHNDTTWAAQPAKHCGWCPVRKWCPDAMSPQDVVPEGDDLD